MRKLYRWQSRIGWFYIGERDGRFHALHEDDSLGSYASARQALDDLVGGHTFSLAGGVDTSTLELPDDLTEWERVG